MPPPWRVLRLSERCNHVQDLLWQGIRQADGKDVSFGYDTVVTMDFLLDIVTGLYRAAGAEA